MSRREKRAGARVLSALVASILACLPLGHASAQPQGKKAPRIGYLQLGTGLQAHDRAFLKGLNDLGYVDGKTVVIEYRGDRQRREDRLGELAADLVRLEVDVIVALVPAAAHAAKRATRTIPIVMRASQDPVASGLVASLAKPGGNVTGVTSIAQTLTGKRMELLKEMVPGIARVGVLWDPDSQGAADYLAAAEADSRLLGMTVQSLPMRVADDFVTTFRAATKSGVQGLVTLRNPLIVGQRKRIAALTNSSRLPAVFDEREFAEAGGLMSYGANLADLYRHAALYVDRILKGAKPADLPVEQPTKFELVVNLKTAKALGITIPQSMLLRADEVIE